MNGITRKSSTTLWFLLIYQPMFYDGSVSKETKLMVVFIANKS